MRRLIPALSLSLITVLGVACQQPAEEEAPAEAPAEQVENAELGVAVAGLPAFFQVRSNDAGTIVLEPKDPAVEGTLTIAATEPETGGINLVAAIEEHKADLEGRESGAYKGQRELGSQLGTAFYSRGQWSDGARTMEETTVFLIHPAGDRKLTLTYVYPAGEDSSARLMEQLFAVLGEIEPVASEPAAEPAEEAAAEATEEAG